MTNAVAIVGGVLLDALVGDPPLRWHPVRLMGKTAAALERRLYHSERAVLRGAVVWLLCAGGWTVGGWLFLRAARALGPVAEAAAGALLVAVSTAARDLAAHARRVARPLVRGDLDGARRAAAHLVSRDTHRLSSADVAGAAVESVAENTVDAVTAPLFWAAVAGPVGALAYRAVNTLDAVMGYRTPRYLHFGRWAARADDAATWIPARLTAGLLALAAWMRHGAAADLGGLRGEAARHPSPNAGWSQAAFARVLQVRLAGRPASDHKEASPVFFAQGRPPAATEIDRAVSVLWGVTLLCLAAAAARLWGGLS